MRGGAGSLREGIAEVAQAGGGALAGGGAGGVGDLRGGGLGALLSEVGAAQEGEGGPCSEVSLSCVVRRANGERGEERGEWSFAILCLWKA